MTTTTYNVQFIINADAKKPFLYLACYDKKGNYYSSNYYNNNDTSSRGAAANLTVENGCKILGVYVDNNVSPAVYYAVTPMYVSDATKLPNDVISVSIKSTPDNFTTITDLSKLTTTSMALGLIKDISTLVTPIEGNSDDPTKSDQADTCISAGDVIIGDAAVTVITRTNGGYYHNHNICVSNSVIQAYKSNYITSSIWAILLVILIIIAIAIVMISAYELVKKHKMHKAYKV